MNDGGCDPQGRFWAGTAGRVTQVRGTGALYRLDTDNETVQVLPDVSISNGIGWSPSGDVTYYIDTPAQRIDRFRFDSDTGMLSHRKVLAEIPASMGAPDGLAVDADGCIWVAVWTCRWHRVSDWT